MFKIYTKIDLDIIMIVGKEGCENCEKAKEFFRKNKKEFIYSNFKDLSQPLKQKIAKTLKDKSIEPLYPFIIVGDFIFSGFNAEFWEKLVV